MDSFIVCNVMEVRVEHGYIANCKCVATVIPSTFCDVSGVELKEMECYTSRLDNANATFAINVNVPQDCDASDANDSKLSETILNVLIKANRNQYSTLSIPIIGMMNCQDKFAVALIGAIYHLLSFKQHSQFLHKITIIDLDKKKIECLKQKFSEIILGESASGSASGSASESASESEDEQDECAICLRDIIINPTTIICGHIFCKECLDRWNKPICPMCKYVYKKLIGDQPDGSMTHKYSDDDLPGYFADGHIKITYNIRDGIQSSSHPNPGKPFSGTVRNAYLPNNKKGKDVLTLLERAFDQKLIFTVGRSNTSGQDDVVVWNDIHHKSTIDGKDGIDKVYGYPDPDYLDRVADELASKGITL